MDIQTRTSLRFLLNDRLVELTDVAATQTLLDFLRLDRRLRGTKEGCAEGDCGACTVLVGRLTHGQLTYESVNACIRFVGSLDACHIVTVEALAAADGTLHPVQQAMVDFHGSQCGFCTPGFVMSLYGRCVGASGHDLPVADVLAGNLCRCTGYGPILAAADATGPVERDDIATVAALKALSDRPAASGQHGERRWFAPRSGAALADLLADHPDARMVAGATDVGLWVTKGLRSIDTLIFLGDIAELQTIEERPAGVRLGAGARYADVHAAFARLHPDLGELTRRIGGLQVRNAGTVGGNIANGSPIGDGPPAFIALGAELTLRSRDGRRTMPLEEYFLDYGKQDRRPWEFVESLWIPRPGPDAVIHIAKLSRRFDSDISAVCGAFHLTVDEGTITAARIAFGGVAATPRRAPRCEAALVGQPFTLATMEQAAAALRTDYAPLSDVRGSSAYRLDAAANLLLRLWHREQGQAVSVLDLDAVHG